MKYKYLILGIALSLLVSGCGNSKQINGHSLRTVYRSVTHIKERLPESERVQFEIAYWSLRNEIKEDAEFLKTVDQKTSEQLITLGKQLFAQKKAENRVEIAHFDSWEAMVDEQIKKRSGQMDTQQDTKDKKNYPRVDYKLHAM